MLMNDKITFARYYCIISAQTKEEMVHYILQPRYIFIHVKAFILILAPSGGPETSINKCGVLTALAHANRLSSTRIFLR